MLFGNVYLHLSKRQLSPSGPHKQQMNITVNSHLSAIQITTSYPALLWTHYLWTCLPFQSQCLYYKPTCQIYRFRSCLPDSFIHLIQNMALAAASGMAHWSLGCHCISKLLLEGRFFTFSLGELLSNRLSCQGYGQGCPPM